MQKSLEPRPGQYTPSVPHKPNIYGYSSLSILFTGIPAPARGRDRSAIPPRSWALLLAEQQVQHEAAPDVRPWAPQMIEQGPIRPQVLQGIRQDGQANRVEGGVRQSLLVCRLGKGADLGGQPGGL